MLIERQPKTTNIPFSTVATAPDRIHHRFWEEVARGTDKMNSKWIRVDGMYLAIGANCISALISSSSRRKFGAASNKSANVWAPSHVRPDNRP